MLAASNGSAMLRNGLTLRLSVRPSVSPIFFLTLIERAAHTQRDLPVGSTRRSQPSEYYEDGHTVLVKLRVASKNL